MTHEPLVQVTFGGPDWSGLSERLHREFPGDGLRTVLDGRDIHSIDQFYSRIAESVPLVQGFGKNLDALLDLFRTFGWGNHAGGEHLFVWYRPEVMLRGAPDDFQKVMDIVVGGSKELLVGEEADPDFDPTDADDWLPTRLNLLFACDRPEDAERVAKIAANLSSFWEDEFHSLDVSVELRSGG